MQELVELAAILQKANFAKYEILLMAFRNAVEAEAALAGVDLAHLLELFRQPISA